MSSRNRKMEDFVEDCYVEIDEEYEFDASQFFDFTKPELDSQIEEVERWFQFSGDYPHSPFIVKLDLDKIMPAEASPRSSKSSKNRRSTKSMSSSSDTDSRHGVPSSKKNIAKEKGHQTPPDSAKPKTKPVHKSPQLRSSNFMEPTASHLAKQNNVQYKPNSSNLCTRFQRTQICSLEKKKSPITSPISDNLATKRQKIETGFLKKGSYLKHKFSLSHKSKKVTVPREPELETLLRSQRRRSKNSSASSETESQKQKSKHDFKAHHPPNRKARSLPRPRKSKTPLTEFQEFNFKTMERANHHSSAKESRSSTGESPLESPLAEEFNKLSLGPKSRKSPQSKRRSSGNSKGSSRSTSSSRGSVQTESWRLNQHCGDRARVHEANMTRSLDIR